jgi:hypothetical protein
MAYGDKRDFRPIHIWHRLDKGGDGKVLTTTWAKTVKEARERYAAALGISVKYVGGEFK